MGNDYKVVFDGILTINKLEDEIAKLDDNISSINDEIRDKLIYDYFVLLEEDIKDLSKKEIDKYLPKGYKDFLGKIVCSKQLSSIYVEDSKLIDKGWITEVPGYGYIHANIYFDRIPEDRLIQTSFRVNLYDVKQMNEQYERFNF